MNNVLTLDEKKIRKGKPVGLPYVGSKKKISKKIAQIIAQNFGTDKPVYDLFGGGGAVSLELMLNGFEDVHYNELDKMTFAAFRTALYADFDVRDLIATREEFLKIRGSEHDGIGELKLLVNSFGNNRKGYLYSKPMSEAKTNLAKKIVWEESDWRQYKQTETYKSHCIERIQQIEQINRIKSIEQIKQIQRDVNDVFNCTNDDYKKFSYLSGSILYLDPPYENAINEYLYEEVTKIDEDTYRETRNWLIEHPDVEKIVKDDFEFQLGKHSNNKNRMYVKHFVEEFDSKEFYNWAYNMSKNNIVIISSYEVCDERFEPVFEFKNARSTFNSNGYGNRTEKLFMVKAGL